MHKPELDILKDLVPTKNGTEKEKGKEKEEASTTTVSTITTKNAEHDRQSSIMDVLSRSFEPSIMPFKVYTIPSISFFALASANFKNYSNVIHK